MWPASGIDKASCLLRNKFAIPQLKNYITNSFDRFWCITYKMAVGVRSEAFLKAKLFKSTFQAPAWKVLYVYKVWTRPKIMLDDVSSSEVLKKILTCQLHFMLIEVVLIEVVYLPSYIFCSCHSDLSLFRRPSWNVNQWIVKLLFYAYSKVQLCCKKKVPSFHDYSRESQMKNLEYCKEQVFGST